MPEIPAQSSLCPRCTPFQAAPPPPPPLVPLRAGRQEAWLDELWSSGRGSLWPCPPRPHLVPEGGHSRPAPQRPLPGWEARAVRRVFTPPSHRHGAMCPSTLALLRVGGGKAGGAWTGQYRVPDSSPGPTGLGMPAPGRWAVPSKTLPSVQPDPFRIMFGGSGATVAGVFPARLKYSLLAGGSKGCFNS